MEVQYSHKRRKMADQAVIEKDGRISVKKTIILFVILTCTAAVGFGGIFGYRSLTEKETGKRYWCAVKNRVFVSTDRSSAAYDGANAYYFCCDDCKVLFRSNPESYIKGSRHGTHKKAGASCH